MVEVCVVAGSVGFHWERVPGRSRVPRGLWARVRAAAEGQPGWAPGAPGTILDPGSAASLRRLAGTWLAAHRDGVHHLDLDHETRGDALRGRLRLLLGTPPGDERVLPV